MMDYNNGNFDDKRELSPNDYDGASGYGISTENDVTEENILHYPLEELFCLYAKFGDPHNIGDQVCLKNLEKWFKQAKIKSVTPQDPSLHFTRVAKGRKSISYREFLDVIEKLASEKQMALETMKMKLIMSGPPLPNNPTKFGGTGVYDRLTDKSKYTGVHKTKYEELCRGKPKTSVYTGYVTGYKMEGSYDKKH